MIETSLNANIGETSATIMCSFVDQWLVVCNVHKLLHQDRPGHFCPQSCTAWFKFDLHSSTCTDDHCVFVQNALGGSLIILSKKDQKSIYIYSRSLCCLALFDVAAVEGGFAFRPIPAI